MNLVGELRKYKKNSVGLSMWQTQECGYWSGNNLMPDDIFVILEEKTNYSETIMAKVLRVDGKTGWVSKRYAMERSEPLV